MSDSNPEQRKWYEHPLANVLVGFLLAGVLGTAITQHFMDRREKEKLRAQAALDRKEGALCIRREQRDAIPRRRFEPTGRYETADRRSVSVSEPESKPIAARITNAAEA
jgi:hypothetical protein